MNKNDLAKIINRYGGENWLKTHNPSPWMVIDLLERDWKRKSIMVHSDNEKGWICFYSYQFELYKSIKRDVSVIFYEKGKYPTFYRCHLKYDNVGGYWTVKDEIPGDNSQRASFVDLIMNRLNGRREK